MFLNDYFYALLNLVAVPTVRILIKFVKQLLLLNRKSTSKQAIIAVLINPRRSRILLFPDCFRFCRLLKTQNRRYPRSFRMDGDKSGESAAFLLSRRVPVLCDGWQSFPTNENSNLYRRGRRRWISLITNPTNPLSCWAAVPLSRKFQFLADFSISG